MNKNKKNNSQITNSGKSSFIKRAFRFATSTVAGFLLIVLIISSLFLIGLNLKPVRQYGVSKAMSLVNDAINGSFTLKDIRISPIDGLILEEPLLTLDGDTIVSATSISAHVSLFTLLEDRIIVNRIHLKKPFVHLNIGKDSLLNISKVFKPSAEDTSSSGGSNLFISVEQLEITDGRVLKTDEIAHLSESNSKRLDFNRFDAVNLHLDISAKLNLKDQDFKVNIHDISLKEQESGLRLKDFRTKAQANTKKVSAEDTYLQIGDTKLRFDAIMDGFSPFAENPDSSLQNSTWYIDLKSDKLRTSDIASVIELPIKIRGDFDTRILAIGNMNELEVQELTLIGTKNEINASGRLMDFTDERNLRYEFDLSESSFNRQEIIQTLPGIELDAMPEFGTAYFSKLKVFGTTDSAAIDMNFDSDLGSVKGTAYASGFSGKLRYAADVYADNVDISKMTPNAPQAQVTGKIKARGIGVDISTMNVSADIVLGYSVFEGNAFDSLVVRAELSQGRLVADTLIAKLRLKQPTGYETGGMGSLIMAGGSMDLSNMNDPSYKFNVEFVNINFADLLGDESMPKQLGGSLSIDGRGFELDSLEGKLIGSFSTIAFDDRMLLPFDITASIERHGAREKSVNVESEFVTASLNGEFTFSDMISLISLQGNYLANFFASKLNMFNPEQALGAEVAMPEVEISQIGELPKIDGVFSVEIQDLSPVNSFIKGFDVNADVKLDFHVFSEGSQSNLQIDSISIRSFSMRYDSLTIKSAPMILSGGVTMSILDSMPKFDKFDFNIVESQRLLVDEMDIERPYLSAIFDGSNLNYGIAAEINKIMKVASRGNFLLEESHVKFTSDTLAFGYLDQLKWVNQDEINISLTPEGFDIHSLTLVRDTSESISLSGYLKDEGNTKLKLSVKHFPLRDMRLFLAEDNEDIAALDGQVDSLEVKFTGTLNKPQIKLDTYLTGLGYRGYKFGEFYSSIDHISGNSQGHAFLIRPSEEGVRSDTLFSVLINALPIYIGMDSTKTLFDVDGLTDIRINADALPLRPLDPLIPGLTDLAGYANASIVISDDAEVQFNYSGKLELKNAAFLLEATNIAYQTSAKIEFDRDEINFKEIDLRNLNTSGSARGEGYISLDGFDMRYLEFQFKLNALQVLSQDTKASMPNIYGNLVVSSGSRPVKFYGSLDKPSLEGDIIVEDANIRIGGFSQAQPVTQKLEYKIVEDENKIVITSKTYPDSTVKDKNVKSKPKRSLNGSSGSGESFADKMAYNLRVSFKRDVSVLIDLGTFGQVYANITTPQPNGELIYIKKRGSDFATLLGSLRVKNSSTLQYIKAFNIQGTISFPTGVIGNPTLDLTAIHRGTSTYAKETKNYKVTLDISGTLEKPQIDYSYTINGVVATGGTQQIKEDALSLLIAGVPKSELQGSGALKSNALSLASTLVSKQFTDLFNTTGFIQSADIDFSSQNGNENENEIDPNLKLTASLFGANVIVSGSATEFQKKNEITIEVPLSVWMETDFWRNFIIQASYSTDNTNSKSRTLDAKEWELKMKYGGSF